MKISWREALPCGGVSFVSGLYGLLIGFVFGAIGGSRPPFWNPHLAPHYGQIAG
jgi:hypothetical protein